MNKAELGKVFKAMTEDIDTKRLIPNFKDNTRNILGKICFIGQPVLINEDKAVLRIALGSDSLRQFIDNKDAALKDDKAICSKMSMLGFLYEKL